jgi:hypothetical protein
MAKKSVENEGAVEVNQLSDMPPATESAFDEAFGEGTSGTSGSEKAEVTDDNLSTAGDESALGTNGTQAQQPKNELGTAGTSGEDYKHKYETLQGLFTQEKTEKENLKTQLSEMATKIADIEKLKTGTPAEKKEAKEIKADLIKQLTDLYADLSEEELSALATYDDEFDTVSKSEAKKREQFAKRIAAYVNDAIENSNKTLLTELAPYLLANEKRLGDEHLTTIKTAHPDFEKYRDDGSLKNWIESQPAYLKKEFSRVYNEGESDEVIDLYSRFKKDNNIGSAGTAGTKGVEIDADKQKTLNNQEVVDSGKRAVGVGGGTKAKDYDGAFDEALAASQK